MPFVYKDDEVAYRKRYRAANKEKLDALHKAWRDKNREHVRALGKAWRLANPDKVKEANKKWYAENGEAVIAFRRAYAPQHSENNQRCRINNYARYAWRGARASAKNKGRPFALSFEDAAALIAATPICPVLGIPLVPSVTGRAHDNSPSFDCFLPELGYVAGNVSVISWRANKLKSDATPDEILRLAAWVEATTVGNL